MSLLNEYARVTHQHPCPVCGHGDWCLVHRSGRKCICTRTTSHRRAGEAGHIHYISEDAVDKSQLKVTPKEYLPPAAVRRYLDSVSTRLDDELFWKLCHLLRLSTWAASEMRGEYDPDKAALAFPMFNEEREPCGVRFRRRDGRKWSLKGGREGVFLSRHFSPTRPVFVTEGPTDAAALVDAGILNVIGRPNCSGGIPQIQAILRHHPHTPIVILSDPNEVGVAGSERLALSVPNPTIILAGKQDVREFVTKFEVRTDARKAILKVLAGYTQGVWKPIGRNPAGQAYQFQKIAETFNVSADRHNQNEPGEYRTIGQHHIRPAVEVPGGVLCERHDHHR